MPNFSFFWRKHYHEIGNCCMTYPLEGHVWTDPDRAKARDKFGQKQLVKDFIDVGWMHQKGLKWIGWDIQGWLAWTDPNGMLYRIKDLKRNEDGVAFEKEVNEVKSELKPRTHQGNPSAEALYRFERDMQKDCGFCPGDRRGSVDPEVDRKPGMDAQPEEEINLDDLMKGDYSPFVPGGYNGVIDQEEITTTGFVTYGGYIDEWSGGDGKQDGGIVKEIIDPVGVLPPKPLPTPPEKQTPPGKRGLPDMPTSPTDTKPVTKTQVDKSIYTGKSAGAAGTQGSVGAYGAVTPTVNVPTQGEKGKTASDLAKELLQSKNVTFGDGHVSGVNDKATASDNIKDIANGKKAQRSNYGTAPGGEIDISPKMLEVLLQLSKEYSFRIEEFTGASHSKTSAHYKGTAVDINKINGQTASQSNPYFNKFVSDARRLGVKNIIADPAPGHKTHIHLQF